MLRTVARLSVWVALLVASSALVVGADSQSMTIEVDARDLPRKLLHARITVPVPPGEQRFAYPKWMPGTHAGSGPVQNVGGLRFLTKDGKALDWKRDDVEFWQFVCVVPPGISELTIEVDYICSQPDANSRGVDSFGNSLIGVINWNTCLVYPFAWKPTDVSPTLSLQLPEVKSSEPSTCWPARAACRARRWQKPQIA